MAESRRDANKIKCRTRILKASRRLFKEKGYEGTMIEEVADKAEVSKGTLYNYFPNKESLLVGTAEEELTQIERLLKEGLSTLENSADKLRQIIIFLVVDSLPFMEISKRISFLNSRQDSPLYPARTKLMALLTGLIEDARREGVFKQHIDGRVILDIVISVYLMAQFQWEDIGSCTSFQCRERLNQTLDLVLADIYEKEV